MRSDDEIYHAPLRLLIVIEAPDDDIERLLDRDHSFRQRRRTDGFIWHLLIRREMEELDKHDK
ncbi:Na-translocating system protein MpsB [Bacillus licheniformis]|nr:Na-translocating system protein MpsB [Bacillus licheniformis]